MPPPPDPAAESRPRSAPAQALRRWFPWAAEVDRRTLRADLAAAPLAALLVLPQGIAFATLAGLPPAWGLYAAVVPALVASLAGSSRHMLTGPTNAIAVALAASLAPLAAAGTPEYLALALGVTLLVGLVQLAVGLLRLGTLAHFISPAVLLGFTTGAAALIAWQALRSLLGLPAGWPLAEASRAAEFAPRPTDLLVAAVTVAVALGLRRWPATSRAGLPLLLGLLAGLALAAALRLAGPGWATPVVGPLPSAWPPFAAPPIELADVPRLAGIALALTLIALGQTMAIAKTLAERSGHALDSNRESVGQGLGNVAAAFFSSFVVAGSFNRSMPHQDAGARTPLAGAFAALLVLALVALAAPLLAWVPMPAVQGLLLVVAASLVEPARWRELLRLDRREGGVAAGTLVAMIVLPIEIAILAGVAASLLVYLYRSAHPALRRMGFAEAPAPGRERPFVVLPPGGARCPQLTLLRMEGNVFFGAVPHVAAHLQALRDDPVPARHLLVMAKSMNFIDAAGVALWEDERRRRLLMDGGLYFHRPRPEVMAMWGASGFVERLGAGHLFASKREAIAAIVPKLDSAICAGCRARIFEECAKQPGAPVVPAAAADP